MAAMTPPRFFHGARWVALIVVVAVSSTIALAAWALGPGPRGGMGPGLGPGLMGSPEQMGRMVDHMLDGLGATDQQRSQIKQIVQAAAADLRQQAGQRRALHERAMQLFTAPTVDANAAEQVRQQMLALHDVASKRMLSAMLDISGVLTAEQRAKIAAQMSSHAERMRERHDRMLRQQPNS
jgi:periplasmic protein CpxP/Spy